MMKKVFLVVECLPELFARLFHNLHRSKHELSDFSSQ